MATLATVTLRSSNAKTGPIPVSTSCKSTCPPSCPFRGTGCYAESGPLALHWAKVPERGLPWRGFCLQIAALPDGQLWRHNQAGDLPGVGAEIDESEMLRLIEATAGRRGFTYTHKPMTLADNRLLVEHANSEGFTVNLSADSLTMADALADLGVGPVVVVLPADATRPTTTPAGRKVAICPTAISDSVTCAVCGLCALPHRKAIIGFPAHGARKRVVSSIVGG